LANEEFGRKFSRSPSFRVCRRNWQLQSARYPMMHHNRAFSASGSSADSAAIAVPSEHLLPHAAEIFLILPLERVARGTHAQRENLSPSGTAVKRPLNTCPDLLHFPLPIPLRKSILLPRTTPGRTASRNPISTLQPQSRHFAPFDISVKRLPADAELADSTAYRARVRAGL